MTPLPEATHIVTQALGILAPFCARIDIAGGVRRGKQDPHDGELVAIARPELLGEMDALVKRGAITKATYGETKTLRWGAKYRGFHLPAYPNFKIELFLATELNWGYIYWLRTGSGDANKRIMNYLNRVNAPIRFRDSECVWARGGWEKDSKGEWQANDPVILNTPDEDAVFALLGIPFVEPRDRSEQHYEMLAKSGKFTRPPITVYEQYVRGNSNSDASFLPVEPVGQSGLFPQDTWKLMQKQDDWGGSGVDVKSGKECEPRPSMIFYADYIASIAEDERLLRSGAQMSAWLRELVVGRLAMNRRCLAILDKQRNSKAR